MQRNQVVAERCFGLPVDRVGDDIAGHERVAVAVTTDPRSHRDRRRRVDRLATEPSGNRRGQVAGEFGHHVEQAGLVIAQRLVDLVSHAQLRQPEQRRLPQQQHLHRQAVLDVGDGSSVPSPQIEFVEEPTHLLEHLEHGLSAHLGGVGGDHRCHLEPVDGVAHRLRRDAGVDEPIEQCLEAAGASGPADGAVMPPATFDVHVFGGVGQQRQPVERTEHQHLFVERMFGECRADVIDRGAAGATRLDGDLADRLDQIEDGIAVGGPDGIAEESSQQSDVVTDGIRARGAVGHRAGGVSGHGSSQAHG